MRSPVSGRISSGFRSSSRPNHQGIDYAVPVGTPVSAGAGGTVVRASYNDTYGNVVVIDHGVIDGKRTYTLYAHLDSFNGVVAGSQVSEGQIIGNSGDTGARSQGAHLHHEVIQVDPDTFPNGLPWLQTGPMGVKGDEHRVNPLSLISEPVQIDFPDNSIPILEQSVLDFDDAKDDFVTPIILDLDGDGVETIGVTAGAYFDHDGNGFAEQTGWAGADDGLLVWDRNGDGRINDGKELFGSETLLSDGTKAANGYAALAELDTNTDGRVDATDTSFANLKVWKDLDGDGYSAASELKTLAELNIQSLNTGATGSTYTDPNGNQHKLTGTFTKTDGTTGSTADVWFQTDKLYTIQEEYLTVPADIAALPDLRGYGNVYDLQQAMVRDVSGQLKTLVESFSVETNPTHRDTLFEQILFKWTGADTLDPASRGGNFDARKLAALEKFFGRGFVGVNGPNPNLPASVPLYGSYQGLAEMFHAQLMAQTHLKPLYDQITYSWDATSQSIKGDLSAVIAAVQAQVAVDPDAGKLALSEFARSVNGLQAQTTLDFTAFRDTLAASDAELGSVIDAAVAATVYATTGNDILAGDSEATTILAYAGNDTIYDLGGANVIDAGAGDDSITVDGSRRSGNHNTIDAGDGNDSVTLSGDGDNVIRAGAGNDAVLTWGNGSNAYDGGAGDDTLTNQGQREVYGRASDQNTFRGGLGNDRLQSGTSTDTYYFDRGDGADTINDYDRGSQGATDTLSFGAGIAIADLAIHRLSGGHLLVGINDPLNPASTDRIIVENWFTNSAYRLERVTLADGTILSAAELEAVLAPLPLEGTDGNDTINGSDQAEAITTYAGNDTIYDLGGANVIDAGSGDDTITVDGSRRTGNNNTVDGGSGNDTVTLGGDGNNTVRLGAGNDSVLVWGYGNNAYDAGAGDDVITSEGERRYGRPSDLHTFVGGTGNDRLLGGASTDTYTFNRGDGADTVNDYDWGSQGATDTVQFGAGIVQSDLSFHQISGGHLLIRLNDPANPGPTGDRITVESWFAGAQYRLERFAFADGTVLGTADIEARLTPLPLEGTDGNDTINGSDQAETILAYAGNDTIYDLGGANVIDAGAGDDSITVDGSRRSGNHNTVDAGSGNDSVTLGGDGNNTVRLGDGADTVLTWGHGSNSYDGGAGDDTLTNQGQRLYGRASDQQTFRGGLGNDRLYGGASTDTYTFDRGDGADSVNDYDWGSQGATDTVQFGAGIASLDLVLSRSGNNLVVSTHATTDRVTVENWYAGSQYQIENIKAGGSTLVNTQVEQLIQAMASFSANNGGIGWDQAIDQRPEDVQAILAANWMPAA